MIYIIKSITCVMVSLVIQMTSIGGMQAEPEEVAAEFLDGIKAGQQTVTSQYMDNQYIQFLETSVDQETRNQIYETIFSSFAYEILDVASSETAAVAKVEIENADFSGIMAAYDQEANQYLADNLYEEGIEDKTKLSDKCLEIYLNQLKLAAAQGPKGKTTIYLPMKSDGHKGWVLEPTEEIMAEILGNL